MGWGHRFSTSFCFSHCLPLGSCLTSPPPRPGTPGAHTTPFSNIFFKLTNIGKVQRNPDSGKCWMEQAGLRSAFSAPTRALLPWTDELFPPSILDGEPEPGVELSSGRQCLSGTALPLIGAGTAPR